jgi:uncharacterized protein (TIGR00290 family)
MSKAEAIVSWSGGKDSLLALHEVLQAGEYEVRALLTTVNEDGVVGAHGVGSALLEMQAAALGLPLRRLRLPSHPSNEEYETATRRALAGFARSGVTTVVAGDLFLADVRAYREHLVESVGMEALFPLWGRDTSSLAGTFLDLGFKAVVCCVDSRALDASFVGSTYDEGFLARLPAGVDPCGENGEFHTFAYDGPLFGHSIRHSQGEVTLIDGRFYQCQLLPAQSPGYGSDDGDGGGCVVRTSTPTSPTSSVEG